MNARHHSDLGVARQRLWRAEQVGNLALADRIRRELERIESVGDQMRGSRR